MQKNRLFLPILLGTLLVGFLYTRYKTQVFQLPSQNYWLSKTITDNDIRQLGIPQIGEQKIEYTSETFVNRNALKFIQKSVTHSEFEKTLSQENAPFWGWNVHVKKPVLMDILLSHQKKLIGFKYQNSALNISSDISSKNLLEWLAEKTNKDFSSYKSSITQLPGDIKVLILQKQIDQTNLIEKLSMKITPKGIEEFHSEFLLPTSYAQIVNADIEKQKTLHQFFNIFHYLLIAIVFLFLFKIHEKGSSSWRSNLPVFSILFLTYLMTFIFKFQQQYSFWIALPHALLKTITHTFWMMALVIAADFAGRIIPQSRYALSDLTKRSFFHTNHFRVGLFVGWVLAVWQIFLVGGFYKLCLWLGSYIPMKIPGEHSTFHAFEWTRYFFDSLSTAAFEEIFYRLFFISLLIIFFKRTWFAVVASAILWGFLHFSYQFEPYYVRGLELTLVGLMYGFVMIRYGIFPAVVAHFLYNGFVISEYEHQSTLFIGLLHLLMLALYGFSLAKNKNSYVYEPIQYKEVADESSKHQIDRRDNRRRIIPLNWKYALVGLICLVGIFLFIPLHLQQASRSINKVELMKFSNQIVQPYMQGKESWSFVYHSENPGIQELKNSVLKIDDRNKHAILDQLNDYTYMWSVRYLTSPDSKTICDVNYSFQNELIGMKCDAPVQKKSFQDWVLAIKEPSENWTLLNLDKVDDDLIYYKYNIASEKPSMISKTAHMAFQNQQLLSFKKQINYFTQSKSIQEEPRNHWINVAYAIFATLVLGLFSKTVLATVRAQNFYERKSMIASVITVILYLLWLSNSYRETLMQYGTGITLNHFITNQSLIVCIKMIVLWFGSYLLFYSFFHIPSQVFGYVPSSKEWNNVLKRPIWMWRNAKVSLLYALLLLLIQLLLRALVQVNNGLTELDLFHFDISYLNHEFLFISFLCLLWKNMMVWMVLLIIISILEKTFPRWIYMAVLAVVLSLNIVMSNQNLNSMLIEFCGIYIVFYFIYNIARFDFAFYFWFVLFNTLSTFIPILLYPGKYSPYIYHVVFVFIFVIAMMLFTLFHSFRHKITMQEPNRIGE